MICNRSSPPRWFHICSAERTLTPQIPLHEQNKLSVNRARIQLALWISANRKQLAPPRRAVVVLLLLHLLVRVCPM